MLILRYIIYSCRYICIGLNINSIIIAYLYTRAIDAITARALYSSAIATLSLAVAPFPVTLPICLYNIILCIWVLCYYNYVQVHAETPSCRHRLYIYVHGMYLYYYICMNSTRADGIL